MNKHLIVIGVAVLLLVVGFSGCIQNNENENEGNKTNNIEHISDFDKFIGKWKFGGTTAWIFRTNGTCKTPLGESIFKIENEYLIVEIGSYVYTYEYTFLDNDNKLLLDRGSKAFTLEREV